MALLVGKLLENAASAAPGRIAATLGERQIGYRDLHRDASRLANALASIGMGRGTRLLYWGTISFDALRMFFACAQTGAAFAPVNPAGSVDEVRAITEYLYPQLLVVDRDHLAQGEVIATLLNLRLAVLGGGGMTIPGIDLDAVMAAAADRYIGPDPEEDDPHVIFLTSGSTGRPKGVVISHRAGWLRASSFQTETTSGGGGDVNMFPLFHMAGWTMTTSSINHLRSVHLTERAEAEILLGTVERWQARRLYCIPGVWERVLACDKHYDTRSLRHVMTGTYRVEQAMLEALRERFPGTAQQIIYGSTEAGIVLGLNDDEIGGHPNCVGLPVRGVRARIAISGELEVATPCMMNGYYALPDETAEIFDGEWYSTGDLAEREDDGTYRIVGRVREVIRSGGETISPAEVEAAVASYPGIRQVAVIGIPSTEWGEIVCAALLMSPGAPAPSCEALRQHLAPVIASFKHPRQVVVVDTIPMTAATQQIQRAKLRDMILMGQVKQAAA